jgi:hypothetical protein
VHRPRWIAISALITIFSYIMLDIPDLASPDSSWKDLMQNEVCQPNAVVTENPISNVSLPLLTKCGKFDQRYGWRVTAMVIFSISHFLSGCASGIPLLYGIAGWFIFKSRTMHRNQSINQSIAPLSDFPFLDCLID